MLFSLAKAAGGALAFASFDSTLVPLAENMSITYIKPAVTDITTEVSLPSEDITTIAGNAQTTGKATLELRCRLIDATGEVVATTVNRFQMVRADRIEIRQVQPREAAPREQPQGRKSKRARAREQRQESNALAQAQAHAHALSTRA